MSRGPLVKKFLQDAIGEACEPSMADLITICGRNNEANHKLDHTHCSSIIRASTKHCCFKVNCSGFVEHHWSLLSVMECICKDGNDKTDGSKASALMCFVPRRAISESVMSTCGVSLNRVRVLEMTKACSLGFVLWRCRQPRSSLSLSSLNASCVHKQRRA